ncbi:3-deoxy-7-phosphoheptulonate synthase [Actinosynnema sp. NPDC091369]
MLWAYHLVERPHARHGNRVRLPSGRKTRFLEQVARDAGAVRDVLTREGLRLGGLHLETAATPVTECVGGPITSEDDLAADYRTLCDPRLNPEQARELIDALFRPPGRGAPRRALCRPAVPRAWVARWCVDHAGVGPLG